jgi:hypothetical protein
MSTEHDNSQVVYAVMRQSEISGYLHNELVRIYSTRELAEGFINNQDDDVIYHAEHNWYLNYYILEMENRTE